jgi:hypothetical protein
VSDAVVFHVEAAVRGIGARRSSVATVAASAAVRSTRSGELLSRRAAVPHGRLLSAPSCALGLLLVRAPRESLDEARRLLTTTCDPTGSSQGAWPGAVRGSRRARSATSSRLWLPYRHGLDFVSDMAMAVVRRPRRLFGSPHLAGGRRTGPSAEAQNLPEDTGLLSAHQPTAGVFASRPARPRGQSGSLGAASSGGALLPTPGSAASWWSLASSPGTTSRSGGRAPRHLLRSRPAPSC